MTGPTRFRLGCEERALLLERAASALADCDQVLAAWVFGSFLGVDAPFRDLDIAVLLEHPVSWRSAPRVGRALAEALAPGFPIDVVPLNDAAAGFQHKVVSGGQCIFERAPGVGNSFAAGAASRYFDLRGWLAAHRVAS